MEISGWKEDISDGCIILLVIESAVNCWVSPQLTTTNAISKKKNANLQVMAAILMVNHFNICIDIEISQFGSCDENIFCKARYLMHNRGIIEPLKCGCRKQ